MDEGNVVVFDPRESVVEGSWPEHSDAQKERRIRGAVARASESVQSGCCET